MKFIKFICSPLIFIIECIIISIFIEEKDIIKLKLSFSELIKVYIGTISIIFIVSLLLLGILKVTNGIF